MGWFVRKNSKFQHDLHFFNVPAPTFDESISTKTNDIVADVISKFNARLSRQLEKSSISCIDVYGDTNRGDGFSNGIYNCDTRHLKSNIIPIIENQLPSA